MIPKSRTFASILRKAKPSSSLPNHRHWIAGEFGIVSDEMKASPIRLGDDEAVERVAVKCGKRRKGEDVFERHRLQHQSILLLLVAKHIGEREVQSELAELHLDLQFPDAGEAQMQAIRRRLARSQSRGR
jgi:hypothetical protein